MASWRIDTRKDGTTCTRVFFRHNGKQSCLTFDDHGTALRFQDLISQVGADRALEIAQIERKERGRKIITVQDWVNHHIDHLTGVDPRTLQDYRGYLRNNVRGQLGALPLNMLTRDDVAKWVQGMETAGASSKTIANRHGFLSAALQTAVAAGHIPSNPAAGTRLPRGEKQEMVFLTRESFGALLREIPEPWQPLVQFLVASGCRWGEATALKPTDVDRSAGTVRVSKAWRRGGGGYRIAPPKTRKSVRTINVPTSALDKLDYTGEWLFTNPGNGAGGPNPARRGAGGPVRAPNFRANVWWPALDRAGLNPRPRIHDLRHTCASWLIQAGIPLPVIQQHLGHESIQTTVDVYGHLDRTSGQLVSDAITDMLD